MMTRIALFCALLLAAGSTSLRLDAAPNPEDRYQQWAEALVPPCCRQGSLKNHDSPLAQQAQQELRGMIGENYTDQQIRDAFVERYGEVILMTPDGERGRWLFTMPAAFLLGSTFAAAWFLRRMLRAPVPRLASVPHIEIDDDDLDW